jgi:hypothetical protein
MNEPQFVIWSVEHQAWWRPGRRGYTVSLAHAGRYEFEDAHDIVWNANRYLKGGTCHECMIPETAIKDQTPGCDCDQANNPDPEFHASDCTWRRVFHSSKNERQREGGEPGRDQIHPRRDRPGRQQK